MLNHAFSSESLVNTWFSPCIYWIPTFIKTLWISFIDIPKFYIDYFYLFFLLFFFSNFVIFIDEFSNIRFLANKAKKQVVEGCVKIVASSCACRIQMVCAITNHALWVCCVKGNNSTVEISTYPVRSRTDNSFLFIFFIV